MIDLGLSKLALIGVVALVVVGPEKLPKVARMAGTLFGRAQRYINDVKAEVSREMEFDELRKMKDEVQEAASNVEKSIARNMSEIEGEVHSAFSNPLLDEPTPERQAQKVRSFRRNRLVRSSSIPAWYKQQNGRKVHVISGAARVARFRPPGVARKPPAFFH